MELIAISLLLLCLLHGDHADVYNLTWKMALVLNQLSDASILSTYEAERAPVAKNVIQMSAAMFATGFSHQLSRRIARKLITTFVSLLINHIAVPSSRVAMVREKDQGIECGHNKKK